MSLKSQVFTTPGTHSFTVPTGVSGLFVTLTGGGSGGVGFFAIRSVGDFAGASSEIACNVPLRVTPGDTITITVGSGGAGWTSYTTSDVGGGGGDSSIDRIIALAAKDYIDIGGSKGTADGGGPGGFDANDPSHSANSSGSMGRRESLNWYGGGTGSDPSGGAEIYGCGAGGWLHGGKTPTGSGNVGAAGPASIFGTGPDGAVTDQNGNDASASSYGVGGGGAGKSLTGVFRVGGDAAGGYVAIFWAEP